MHRHRGGAWAALAVLMIVGVAYTAQVDTRMDQSAFFADDSPPARADRFLRRHFGGALFIQVHADADFASAALLRQWSALADRLETLPHVSSVQHIGQVVGQLNAALAGQRRIPDTDAQVKLLYRFMEGAPGVEQMITSDRQQGVMHVKVNTGDLDAIDETLRAVESMTEDLPDRMTPVAASGEPSARRWLVEFVAGRVETIARRADVPLDEGASARLRRALVAESPAPAASILERDLAAQLLSPESLVDLRGDEALARKVAQRLLGPEAGREADLEALFPDDRGTVEDILFAADTDVPAVWRRVRAEAWVEQLAQTGLTIPGGDAGVRFRTRVRDELQVLFAPEAEVAIPAGDGAGRRAFEATVSGLPVLHRGLSRSARRNQIASLGVALGLVVLLLCLLFRSLRFGLAAAVPTVVTLAVVYGAMGVLGVHLDIGTSMLASLIIGAGVDYAVHLVAAYRRARGAPDPLRYAVEETGTAVWTNALMVAAGFYLLTLGEARTLQNVGGLTAAAMMVAALSTFAAVPALLPRATKADRSDFG